MSINFGPWLDQVLKGQFEKDNNYINPQTKKFSSEEILRLEESAARKNEAFKSLSLTDPVNGNKTAFSFANVQAQLLLPFLAPKSANYLGSTSLIHGPMEENYWGTIAPLPGLNMVALSVHRDVYPVVALGRIGIKGYTTGNILYAGSLGFTVFDENPFAAAIRAYSAWRGDRLGQDHVNFTDPSELPPFDISLIYFDDHAKARAFQTIRSVKIVDASRGISIHEIQMSDSYSFMAASVSNLISADTYEKRGLPPETGGKIPHEIYDKKNVPPIINVPPIGDPNWNTGSGGPRSADVDGTNTLDPAVEPTSFNSANWSIGATQQVSGTYILTSRTGTSTGLVSNSVSVSTPYGTGSTLTWQPNLGQWGAGDSYSLRYKAALTNPVTWTASGSPASGIYIANLVFKPNVIFTNLPPEAKIQVSIYDSWRPSPFSVYEADYKSVYANNLIYPGADSNSHEIVLGKGSVLYAAQEAVWTQYPLDPGSVYPVANQFSIPQDYFAIEIVITSPSKYVNPLQPTKVYLEHKMELS